MQGNNKSVEFSPTDVKEMVVHIDDLFKQTSNLYNRYRSEPQDGSQAKKEIRDSAYPTLLETAYSIGSISIEAAGDHLVGFADLLKEPVKTIAPLTCIRSLMESASIACWLLDPSIDAHSRLSRSFSFRYSGFVEQRKLFSLLGDAGELARIDARIRKVEADAIACGYTPILDRNGNRCGIAQATPTTIELVKFLGKEFDYRVLSGVAHAHPWAIQQVGFVTIDNPNGGKALTKALIPNMAVYFGMTGVVLFAKAIWFLWQLYGWEKNEITNLLEDSFTRLNYSDAMRFWR
jgi:hypothetical protein